MRPAILDSVLRLAGALGLALYGLATAFVGLFVAFWDNKGDGSMFDKGLLDWLFVAWCAVCGAVAFRASWSCGTGMADRRALRNVVGYTLLANAGLVIWGARGEAVLYLATPLLLGLLGVVFWAAVWRYEFAGT